MTTLAGESAIERIEHLLGDEAQALLEHECRTIDSSQLHRDPKRREGGLSTALSVIRPSRCPSPSEVLLLPLSGGG
jgi:hypothetical protein